MTEPTRLFDKSLETVCENFEDAWSGGQPIAIEDALAECAEPQRAGLLHELLLIELRWRRKNGEHPAPDDYSVRFPEHAQMISEIISEVHLDRVRADAKLEEVHGKDVPRPLSSRLNCPHCKNPITVDADAGEERLVCPSCGNPFQFDPDRTVTWTPEKLPRLGKFELLEPVGHGAFGTVYKARDTELDRIVAVKVPRSGTFATQQDEDRFIREGRSAAQLNHECIVSVHEVGRSDQWPYIVSEFVDGVTLADVLNSPTGRPFTFRESAELIALIADGLEHSHQRGVIHRDLKPSNLLIESREPLRVKIMDFGLARRDDHEITMTGEGQVLGTPAYMSPEQAGGKGHRADGRTDVYSLGVILYHLLTGELPFQGSAHMVRHQHLHDEPRPPRRLNDQIPRDLETICLKAMAKETSRRYQSARELADDVRRFLEGRPIAARPVGRWERTWRWSRRNPLLAGLAASTVALLLAVTVVSTVFAIRQARLAESERRARAQAEAHLAIALDAVNRVLTEVGQHDLDDVPQVEPVRRKLLEDALELTLQLHQGRPADPELRARLAAAFHGLAGLMAELGRPDEAKVQYEQAVGMYAELAEQFPAEPRYRLEESINLGWLGELHRTAIRDAAAAEEHFRAARRLQQELLDAGVDDPRTRREWTRTWNNYGILLTELRRDREAEAALQSAIDGLQVLHRQDPNEDEYAADLARSRINLGILLKRDDARRNEAEQQYRQAVRLSDELVERRPQKRAFRFKLALAQIDLANLLLPQSDKRDEGRQLCERSVQLLRELKEDFSRIPLYYHELANALNSLSNACALGGDLDEAERNWIEALGVLDDAAQRFPEVVAASAECSSVRGLVHGGLGWLESQRQDRDAAVQHVESAVAYQADAVRIAPEHEQYRQKLLEHYLYLMPMLIELDRQDDAVERLREGVNRGVLGPEQLQNPSLKPLHDRPDFQALLESADP